MWLPFEKKGKKLKAQENALGAHYSTRVFKEMTEEYSYALHETFKTGLGHAK